MVITGEILDKIKIIWRIINKNIKFKKEEVNIRSFDAAKEIYKLQLQDKLNLIGELTEFNKLSPRLFWKLEELSKQINDQLLELKDK